jgi:filamentous hemagglutinin family protein
MNKAYRLIWNEFTNTWVAVSEIVKARGKRASGAVLLAAAGFIAVPPAPTFAAPPNPPVANQLPTNGQVVAGQASIAQSGATMNITQTSQRGVIDWGTFNVGSAATVNFIQPSSSAATLNRVLDPNPSQIFGRINANGQVFLTNASGIYFGRSASVNVGALTVTTHGISNADFMAGNLNFTRNGATGKVENEGSITAELGGYIALLAPEVRNNGVVIAQGGTVALAAGEAFELQFDGARLANIRVEPATIAALVENGNAVHAPGGLIILSAQAANRLQGGVVNNTGALAATGLVDNGGIIRLEASDRIVQSGTLQANAGGRVTLAATGGDGQSAVIIQSGSIEAQSQTSTTPGQISLTADRAVVQTGTLDSSGQNGGRIQIATQNLIDSGSALATGTLQGGSITFAAQGTVMQTTAAQMNVDGGVQGGQLRLTAGISAWLSGNLSAQGTQGTSNSSGGDIAITAPSLTLAGAMVNASGVGDGGRVRIGGGFHGADADLTNALTTKVSASEIDVASRQRGNGGTAVVWSEKNTSFDSRIMAQGGVGGGNGGLVEVSSRDSLAYSGYVDASATQGQAGQLLLDPKNIDIVATASGSGVTSLVDPTPGAGEGFGTAANVFELKNNGAALNRILVLSPKDSTVATDSGAVYLYNSLTGALISTLTGSQASDSVGNGTLLSFSNGNFLVRSVLWDNGTAANAGAVTWGSGTSGVSGVVSAANSLVGSQANDSVGNFAIDTLSSGNYIVRSTLWANGTATNAGAVTWGSNTSGVSGVVSAANSLVGSSANDSVGFNGITKLTNGNYVVSSNLWANGTVTRAGAVTWGNGTSGVSGTVSAANSLVGTNLVEQIGNGGITTLANGNYLVSSGGWYNGTKSGAGAVTWGNGTSGISGTVSAANSLVGSSTDDSIGVIHLLTNGNYLVRSASWDNGTATNAGAVTWGSGTSGVSGTISAANSLIGSQANDSVGITGSIQTLSNGNYLVRSWLWDNGTATNAGALTWGSGTSGVSGTISASNSLIGSQADDSIGGVTTYLLTNGNYITRNSTWDNGTAINAGAVTWGSGTSGVSGTISAANSLIGSQANDLVGNADPVQLANGNYVVPSTGWKNGTAVNAGAVTWGSGTSGVSGTIDSINSLVGSQANDGVGAFIVTLSSGNYLIRSTAWDNGTATNAGAVTWGNGTGGTVGTVSAANSLVGSSANDSLGSAGFAILANGNYLVNSTLWDNGTATNAGAVTWGSGTSGVSGTVSATNSLVGSQANDSVGGVGITTLANGNYVVRSSSWANGTVTKAGAVTWGNGTGGTVGTVSAGNSLVGSQANDSIGASGITTLANSNYVIRSTFWDNGTATNAGHVTWGSGTSGVSGTVSAANSLVGSSANDSVGSIAPIGLSSGNYLIFSTLWGNGGATNAGAVTWGSGTSGVSGTISGGNSLVGSQANDSVGGGSFTTLSNGNYIVTSPLWDNGTATSAGAVTWGSGTSGVSGILSATNSLVGSHANDNVGLTTSVVPLTGNGNYVVRSENWDNGSVTNAGAATWASGTIGVSGTISAANSLVGTQANDSVGGNGIATLSNGNYVVNSSNWANGTTTKAGASTWSRGTSGIVGTIDSSNSLVGSKPNDSVGVAVLTVNATNYVVRSAFWGNGTGTNAGAMTWAASTSGVSGTLSADNSLIGLNANDSIGSATFLVMSDGRALVRSPLANSSAGRLDFLPSTSGSSSATLPLSYATSPTASSSLTVATLLAQLNNGTDVVLQANNDITLSTALTVNNASGNGGALTLQAGRSLLLNANINTDNGNLTLIANDKLANGVVDANRDAGAATITQAAGTSINAGTGTVSIDLRDGAGLTNTTVGAMTLASVNAANLTVQSHGFSASATAANRDYDGTTAATLSPASASGFALQSGSNLTLTVPTTGTFDNANVGTGKTVTSAPFVLTGFNGGATSNLQKGGSNLVATTTANITGITGSTGTTTTTTTPIPPPPPVVPPPPLPSPTTAPPPLTPPTLTPPPPSPTPTPPPSGPGAPDPTTSTPTSPPSPTPTPPPSGPGTPDPTTSTPTSPPSPTPTPPPSGPGTPDPTTATPTSPPSPTPTPPPSDPNAPNTGSGNTKPPTGTQSGGRAPDTPNAASDGSGQAAAGGPNSGGVSVSLVKAPSVQQTGIITVSVPKEMATAGSGFSFPLPAQVTDSAGPNAVIRVTTTSGAPLPGWLKFDQKTKTFVASAVPDGAFPLQVIVTIRNVRTTIVISERQN